MALSKLTRRSVLVRSGQRIAAGWLAFELPWLATLAACDGDAAPDGPFVSLTSTEVRTLRAFAAQIIPSDDGIPGSAEAGAASFIDRALRVEYFAESAPIVRRGLADLDLRARRSGARDFASLSSAKQIGIMRQIERDPFFDVARKLVVIGTFSDPVHGGNRDAVGWTTIGLEHRPSYAAPYGWYDAHPNDDPGPKAA